MTRAASSFEPFQLATLVRVTRYLGVDSSTVVSGRSPIRRSVWSKPLIGAAWCGVIISISAAWCSASSLTVIFVVFMLTILGGAGDGCSASL